MTRELTCIICPRGCGLTANIDKGAVTVLGHSCPKGEEYAQNECLHPMRTVTATIRVTNRKDTMVSVKTASPVPKDKMMEVMAVLRSMAVEAPVAMGQILAAQVLGADIVATKQID